MLRAHFIDTFLKPSGALDKWKGAWEMAIRRRQGGEHFLRIIRKKKVQEFISMRYRGRLLINAPEEELPRKHNGFTSDGEGDRTLGHSFKLPRTQKRQSRPKRGPFFPRPSQSIRGRSVPWDGAVPVTLDTGA